MFSFQCAAISRSARKVGALKIKNKNTMTKKTIEIEDTLAERVQTAKDELRDNFVDYLSENVGMVEFDEYYQAKGADAASEAADSNTPIYNSELSDIYYLHGSELDEAHENAGLGCTKHDSVPSYPQCATYCYISEQAHEFLRTLTEWLDEDYTAKVEELTSRENEAKTADDSKEILAAFVKENAPKE